MVYANQIQELTERSVSGCASGCTHISVQHFCLVNVVMTCLLTFRNNLLLFLSSHCKFFIVAFQQFSTEYMQFLKCEEFTMI